MKLLSLRNLMTLSASLACPYGVFCVVFPKDWLLWVGGMELNGHGLLVARMYGGQVLGFGILSFLARNTPDSPARRAILLAFFLVDLMSFAIAAMAQAQGWIGPAGWIDVLGFAFFAASFGYYALRPDTSDSTQ